MITRQKSLGVFSIAMINIAAIISLHSLPLMASVGYTAITFYLLAALLFLIPSAMVCSELASAYPEAGGIYQWVRRAFGDFTGFFAIHKETGLITFHGALAGEPWPQWTVNYMRQVLFNEEPVLFQNPTDELDPAKDIIQSKDRYQIIRGGTVTAPIVGGNLTVLVSLLGSHYLPNWKGKILFVEDVDEDYYQIDRMMAQLKLAGVLKQIDGFVFGKCTRCKVTKGAYGTFTVKQILDHYIRPLNIPAYMGAMIGHEPKIFTIPEGAVVTVNADKGTIQLLKPAVKA